ncbi:hypothetical protein GW7_14423 [Heterocephalus glaber]|uniref:Uncharacterized protein n=1 Tax=Heterocephalus glaber TaxID=10181 RepID=G5ATZ1_HETGA|nr:hypothetical protein GW7_14423 [Heterocephalus glaber]
MAWGGGAEGAASSFLGICPRAAVEEWSSPEPCGWRGQKGKLRRERSGGGELGHRWEGTESGRGVGARGSGDAARPVGAARGRQMGGLEAGRIVDED